MKILLVNKFLFPKGGDAICTLSTGKLLSQKGHEVSYWGMEHPDNPDYPYSELFVDYVDLVHGGGPFRQVKTAFNILYSFEAKNKLETLLEKIRPDIVHLNNIHHHVSPSILDSIKKQDIPVVMTLHDYKIVCPYYYLMQPDGTLCDKCKGGKYYWCLLNKCTHSSRAKSFVNTLEMYVHHKLLHIFDKIDIFISPSRFLINKVQEMGFDKEIVYLPNFIDTEALRPRYQSTKKQIVYFGRLSPEKGLVTLFKAIKDLDVQLKIVGDGRIRGELEERAAMEGLTNVAFVGHKSREELNRIITDSMATVIPSRWYENNPRTAIESFALGKPVIGANIGGIPELVIDGLTGYTFESGNAEDLHVKIKQLLNDQDKIIEMGRNARQHVEQNNNPEKHYRKLTDIYNKALKHKI